MREKAEELIQEILRPLVRADGGEIDLVSFEDNTITVRLAGTCAGCPGWPYTTTYVIEPVLRRAFGESLQVRYERGG